MFTWKRRRGNRVRDTSMGTGWLFMCLGAFDELYCGAVVVCLCWNWFPRLKKCGRGCWVPNVFWNVRVDGKLRRARIPSMSCLALVVCIARSLISLYVVANGGFITSSSMDWDRPLRKKLIVSSFPMVYPASWARSSNLAMYWSISGNFIRQLSRSSCAHCCCCESVNCSVNSAWNCSHTSSISSTVGLRASIHHPMSHAHLATSLPLIMVKVIDTLRIGDLNPATPLFAQKYPSTSSKKSCALAQLPVKIWGSVPMVLMSLGAAAGMGPWAAAVGTGPAPPGGPPPGGPPLGGPPPGGPPPGGPPPVFPVLRIAVRSLSRTL